MTFAEQLTAAVQRSGLTQPAAADLIEIKPRTLWGWLHSEREPHRYMQEGSLAELAAAPAKLIAATRTPAAQKNQRRKSAR
jgi:transcriptional regulator with XRE-family HTH domain